MSRTLDATLKAALESEHFEPYIKAVFYNSGVGTAVNVRSYKLTGTELDVDAETYIGSVYPAYIAMRRGVVLDGTPNYLDTSKFYIGKRYFEVFENTKKIVRIHATLFPENRIVLAGDDTYRNVITAFCTAFSKTAVFENSLAAHWDYAFLPTGKQVILNNAMQFLNLLRQKYFIFAADNGGEEVLFYHALGSRNADVQYAVWYKDNVDVDPGDIIANNLMSITVNPLNQRTFMARDEAETVRTGGTANKPLHNMGYLESTDAFPDKSTAPADFEAVLPINLTPMDGDIISLDPNWIGTVQHPLAVVEELNVKKQISWSTTLRQTPIFENTAGGALPSTIERVSNYTPLNTGNFDGVLSVNDNNLQAAMDTLDDHTHTSGGGGTWGGITGTLSNQTDLQNALDAKADNSDIREKLTADRTYYVRTDGSDSNDGLANTAGGAFLTIQKAIDVCMTIDLAGKNVTIQLGNGTYASFSVEAPFLGGNVTVLGDTTTPANVVVTSSTGDAVRVRGKATLSISGIKVTTTTGGSSGVAAYNFGTVNVGLNVEYGTCIWAHNYCTTGGTITCVDINYRISGGAFFHYNPEDGGMLKFAAHTVTIVGTPNFAVAFAQCTRQAMLDAFSQTWSGGATGKRFHVGLNGLIFTNGGGGNYFPGNSAGTNDGTGVYA